MQKRAVVNWQVGIHENIAGGIKVRGEVGRRGEDPVAKAAAGDATHAVASDVGEIELLNVDIALAGGKLDEHQATITALIGQRHTGLRGLGGGKAGSRGNGGGVQTGVGDKATWTLAVVGKLKVTMVGVLDTSMQIQLKPDRRPVQSSATIKCL